MNLVGTLTAAWDMVRTFETAEIPIGGIMDAAYVLLSGASLLAAYRTRRHPSSLRRFFLWGYALLNLALLPARSYHPTIVHEICSVLLQVGLMVALAWPPGDLVLFERYFASRKESRDV